MATGHGGVSGRRGRTADGRSRGRRRDEDVVGGRTAADIRQTGDCGDERTAGFQLE